MINKFKFAQIKDLGYIRSKV